MPFEEKSVTSGKIEFVKLAVDEAAIDVAAPWCA